MRKDYRFSLLGSNLHDGGRRYHKFGSTIAEALVEVDHEGQETPFAFLWSVAAAIRMCYRLMTYHIPQHSKFFIDTYRLPPILLHRLILSIFGGGGGGEKGRARKESYLIGQRVL